MPLIFEWNEEKASSNKKKHKVSSEEASTVFGDLLSQTHYIPKMKIVWLLSVSQKNKGYLLSFMLSIILQSG